MKKKKLSAKQMKIAKMAKPYNKMNGADFKKLGKKRKWKRLKKDHVGADTKWLVWKRRGVKKSLTAYQRTNEQKEVTESNIY